MLFPSAVLAGILAVAQACYIVCAPGAGAVGGLLASGILKIDSIGSISGWRSIFWVEGIISMGIGIISWFLVWDRPSACKWLSAEERELAEFRLVAENVGQHQVVDRMHSKAVYSGIFNVNTIGTLSRWFPSLFCVTADFLAPFRSRQSHLLVRQLRRSRYVSLPSHSVVAHALRGYRDGALTLTLPRRLFRVPSGTYRRRLLPRE